MGGRSRELHGELELAGVENGGGVLSARAGGALPLLWAQAEGGERTGESELGRSGLGEVGRSDGAAATAVSGVSS